MVTYLDLSGFTMKIHVAPNVFIGTVNKQVDCVFWKCSAENIISKCLGFMPHDWTCQKAEQNMPEVAVNHLEPHQNLSASHTFSSMDYLSYFSNFLFSYNVLW